ncbi:MAG: flagellar basal-body rod protein FlgG [Deltaproteobacteria bacterium]|nr:flagellar basal-body rod protein FlgG [Deltaproteobacteria bacterium]MBI3075636.1 flagellar basal-body rod protein FlgG [Deltaproteobacteria bacterium]
MIRALWTASSGMSAQQLNLDVVSNNLANVNTVGFKRSRTDFQDLLYQSLRFPGAASAADNQIPTGVQIGHGVRPTGVIRFFAQGDYQQTGNQLDLAIEGDGFFQVQQPNGETAYSRAGAFKQDSQGRIVTSDGYVVLPTLTIPSDATGITVGADGTISVQKAGQTAPSQVGQLQIARFVNPAGLNSIGRNLYLPTASSGDPTTGTPGQNGLGTISQGYLEMSNVSVVEEMVNLIIAQRAYEANSKAVQTADEMLQMANNVRR